MADVLVAQLARFGDLVQTRRLLLSLEREARVHLLVDAGLAELAARLYPFVIIHSLPLHLPGSTTPGALLAACGRLFQELRNLEFAAVYLLNLSPLSYALASLFPPEILRGYARPQGREMRCRWLELCANMTRDRRFSPLNLADLWAFLHPRPISPEKVNPIPRPAGANRVGVALAGRESRRSLPPERLAACAQAVFQARGGPTLVLLGSAAERPLARRLSRLLPPRTAERIEDATGTTSLADLIDVTSGLDLLLTPDTGLMHLAAFLGVPVLAFFLSSAWCFETGPYGFGHKIFQALDSCSPCRETSPCPRDVACLSPFAQPGLLAHLAGKYAPSWPDHLLGCITMLDDLGCFCRSVDGADPYEDGRMELRRALALHLGVEEPGLPAVSPAIGDFLYEEKQWMLPEPWETSPRSGRW